jgi:hypothetical protein
MYIQASVESPSVQAQIFSKLLQIFNLKRALIFTTLTLEQLVMVPPELLLALVPGAFGCFRGKRAFFTQKGEMDVAEPDNARVDKFFFYLLIFANGELTTERSLKIAEFQHGHRGICPTPEVFHLVERHLHHSLRVAVCFRHERIRRFSRQSSCRGRRPNSPQWGKQKPHPPTH